MKPNPRSVLKNLTRPVGIFSCSSPISVINSRRLTARMIYPSFERPGENLHVPPYPVEYGKRAGELIAQSARSLRPTPRQKKSSGSAAEPSVRKKRMGATSLGAITDALGGVPRTADIGRQ